MVRRSYLKSLAGTIPARATQAVPFKKCCMRTGRYDDVVRNHGSLFQSEMKSANYFGYFDPQLVVNRSGSIFVVKFHVLSSQTSTLTPSISSVQRDYNHQVDKFHIP